MTNEAPVHGVETGTIYVLRSHSSHPYFAQHRDLIHKIGVTGCDVALRVSNSKVDPTFLFADVKIVATYKLVNINGQSWKHFCIGFLLRHGSMSKYPIASAA